MCIRDRSKDDQYWRGTVLLWEEHGLFLGNAGRAEMHESPAIKICVSLDGKFGPVSYTHLDVYKRQGKA